MHSPDALSCFLPGIRAVPVHSIPVWNDLTVIRTHGHPKQDDDHEKRQLHLMRNRVLVHNVNTNGEKIQAQLIITGALKKNDHVWVSLIHTHHILLRRNKSKVKAQRMNFSRRIHPASRPPQLEMFPWRSRCVSNYNTARFSHPFFLPAVFRNFSQTRKKWPDR